MPPGLPPLQALHVLCPLLGGSGSSGCEVKGAGASQPSGDGEDGGRARDPGTCPDRMEP